MKNNKKHIVYCNDGVNEVADVFSAETLEECINWINGDIEGRCPVDEEHPCTDDVMHSSKTFHYDVYDRPIVEIIDDEELFNEPVYSTGYYYAQ